jgi:hypothetical protein
VLFDGSFIIAYEDFKVCIWKNFEEIEKIEFCEGVTCVIPTADGFAIGLVESIRYYKMVNVTILKAA